MAMTTLVGGVVYGWPSLRALFIEEGVLRRTCPEPAAGWACLLLLATVDNVC
jgi:hypothetical protein